ncbi:MAG: PsbP-related protein [Candidatus Paceibacterota bacterium]
MHKNTKGFAPVAIIGLVILILAAIGGIGYYLLIQKKPQQENSQSQPQSQSQNNNPYVGDEFTFIPPAGWIRIEIPSTLVAYQNTKEVQPKDSAAEKVHFKSYLAVSFDNANGQKLGEISALVKEQIKASAPAISFTYETKGKIDGQDAQYAEGDLLMQNINFKVIVITVLKGDKYFTISCNTTAEKWPEYRDIFYNTAESFKFK